MKKFISTILGVVMILSLSITSFASESKMTVNEAKEYLQNYNVTKNNEFGKEYTTSYSFNSEEDLDKAACYIANHGLEAFEDALNSAISEVVANEPKSTTPITRSTEPATAYATVSGNGTHSVSASARGMASFDTLGYVEYKVILGYKVTVSNGEFTNLTNISFDIPSVSGGGSWGNARFPSHCTATNCGVSANYDIVKSVEVEVEDFSIVIKSETDNEVFSLLTSLS